MFVSYDTCGDANCVNKMRSLKIQAHGFPSARPPVNGQKVAPLRVLAATIRNVRRYRDFCRIEAIVTVTFQYHPALPPRTERLLTSVPYRPYGRPNDFRHRLIKSAINLSVLMHRSEREVDLRAA